LVDLFYDQIGTDYFFVPGGKASCDRVAAGVDGTVRYFEDAAGRGHACGSPYSPGYSTMMNGHKSASGYLNFTYDISPSTQLYANALYDVRNIDYYVGSNYTW